MEFNYTKIFKKRYKKLSPDIQQKIESRLSLLLKNEFDHILNNHKLNGKHEGSRSINITGDLRIIFQKRVNDYLLEEAGTHSELYE